MVRRHYDKELAQVGETIEVDGQKLTFTPELCGLLIRAQRQKNELGVVTPLQLTHEEHPTNDRGVVLGLRVKPNGKFTANIGVDDDEGGKIGNTIDRVSPRIGFDTRDGRGNKYPAEMIHLAFVSRPVIPNQTPLKPIPIRPLGLDQLSDAGEIVFSLSLPRMVDMAWYNPASWGKGKEEPAKPAAQAAENKPRSVYGYKGDPVELDPAKRSAAQVATNKRQTAAVADRDRADKAAESQHKASKGYGPDSPSAKSAGPSRADRHESVAKGGSGGGKTKHSPSNGQFTAGQEMTPEERKKREDDFMAGLGEPHKAKYLGLKDDERDRCMGMSDDARKEWFMGDQPFPAAVVPPVVPPPSPGGDLKSMLDALIAQFGPEAVKAQVASLGMDPNAAAVPERKNPEVMMSLDRMPNGVKFSMEMGRDGIDQHIKARVAAGRLTVAKANELIGKISKPEFLLSLHNDGRNNAVSAELAALDFIPANTFIAAGKPKTDGYTMGLPQRIEIASEHRDDGHWPQDKIREVMNK